MKLLSVIGTVYRYLFTGLFDTVCVKLGLKRVVAVGRPVWRWKRY